MFSGKGIAEGDWLTVNQVAEQIGYSEQRVRQLLQKGTLQGSKLEGGGKWLISKAGLDRYLVTREEATERRKDQPGAVTGWLQELGNSAQVTRENPAVQGYAIDSTSSKASSLAMETHFRELVAFGQRLRDRLAIPHAKNLYDLTFLWGYGLVWQGEPPLNELSGKRSAEGDAVAHDWGEYEKGQEDHPQYSLFRSHLDGHPCWLTLRWLEMAYESYVDSCRQVNQLVDSTVRKNLPYLGYEELRQATETVLDTALRQFLWAAEFSHPTQINREMSPLDFPEIFRSCYPPKGVMGSMLWISPEKALDLGKLYDYPVVVPGFKKQEPANRKKMMHLVSYKIARDYPNKSLGELILPLVASQEPLPSLLQWRDSTLVLAGLIETWRQELGADPLLRKSIAMGRCQACLE
ncbi:MAG: helix-turn-helix domain-containing protein [Dehalococcoidia bacterium]